MKSKKSEKKTKSWKEKRDRAHPPVMRDMVEEYLVDLQRPREAVLAQLEEDAIRNDVPIAGPLIGAALFLLAKSCNAKNVLEVGTATGYSGIWLARAIGENSGKLTTIEMDPSRKKTAENAFRRARIRNGNVEMMLGDANEIVPSIARSRPESFDMIFMDVGEKSLYSELLDDCFKALRKGGLFVADDTLYRGVANPSVNSKKASVMRSFNKQIFSDARFDPVILPLGDGLTVAVKR